MAHSFQVRPPASKPGFGFGAWCCLSLFCLPITADAAEANNPRPPKPASLKISGYGLLGDRELKRMLRTLEFPAKKPQYFRPDTIEDAALILTSRIKSDGFLRPSITIGLRLADGKQIQ